MPVITPPVTDTTIPYVRSYVAGDLARLYLNSAARQWTISSYGTAYSPNNSFNIADETAASVRLTIDTSGNVGIGVTDPTFKLEVATGSGAYDTAFNIRASTHATSRRAALSLGNNWLVLQDSNGNGTKDFSIYDGTAGAQRFQINTNGTVYIPGYITFNSGLRMGTGFNAGGYTRTQLNDALGLDGTGASAFAWNYSNGGGELDLFINRNGGSGGGFKIYDFPNTTGNPNLLAYFSNYGTAELTIGNGTLMSAAGYGWITVNGAANGACLTLQTAGSEYFRIQSETNATYLNNLTSVPFVFKLNNTEKMRLKENGNLGIGTTDPWQQLSIYGTGTVGDLTTARQISIGTGNNYGLHIGYIQSGVSQPFVGVLQALDTGNGTYLSLNPNGGNVGIGVTTPKAKLHVGGGVGSTNGSPVTSGSAAITMYYDTANDYGVTSTLDYDVAWKKYVIRSAGMSFRTSNDTEAVSIAVGGKVTMNNDLTVGGRTLSNGFIAQYPSSLGSLNTSSNIAVRTDSGFFQTSYATKATGWPEDTTAWYHLLSSTHTNDANYYSMQLAADFYTQKLWYRSTNGNGAQTWNRIPLQSDLPYVTPQQYGAVGDGSADDTTALTNALNSGKPVMLVGKFRTTSPITIATSAANPTISIQGAGNHASEIIIDHNSGDGLTFQITTIRSPWGNDYGSYGDNITNPNANHQYGHDSHSVYLRDFNIVPNQRINYAALVVTSTETGEWTLSNSIKVSWGQGSSEVMCKINGVNVVPSTRSNGTNYGFYFYDLNNVFISECAIDGVYGTFNGNGIQFGGKRYRAPVELHITDCDINWWSTGLYLSPNTGGVTTGGNDWQGVYITACTFLACDVGINATSLDGFGDLMTMIGGHINFKTIGVYANGSGHITVQNVYLLRGFSGYMSGYSFAAGVYTVNGGGYGGGVIMGNNIYNTTGGTCYATWLNSSVGLCGAIIVSNNTAKSCNGGFYIGSQADGGYNLSY